MNPAYLVRSPRRFVIEGMFFSTDNGKTFCPVPFSMIAGPTEGNPEITFWEVSFKKYKEIELFNNPDIKKVSFRKLRRSDKILLGAFHSLSNGQIHPPLLPILNRNTVGKRVKDFAKDRDFWVLENKPITKKSRKIIIESEIVERRITKYKAYFEDEPNSCAVSENYYAAIGYLVKLHGETLNISIEEC